VVAGVPVMRRSRAALAGRLRSQSCARWDHRWPAVVDRIDDLSCVDSFVARLVPCDRVGYNEISPEESFVITVPNFDPALR
jgi:hypothetical protein